MQIQKRISNPLLLVMQDDIDQEPRYRKIKQETPGLDPWIAPPRIPIRPDCDPASPELLLQRLAGLGLQHGQLDDHQRPNVLDALQVELAGVGIH